MVDSVGSNSGDNIVKVTVYVEDADGSPVGNELVKLEDHGPPRLGNTYGVTSSDGKLKTSFVNLLYWCP